MQEQDYTEILRRLTICVYSKEDYGKAKGFVSDAAKSQAYLYPIKVRSSTPMFREAG